MNPIPRTERTPKVDGDRGLTVGVDEADHQPGTDTEWYQNSDQTQIEHRGPCDHGPPGLEGVGEEGWQQQGAARRQQGQQTGREGHQQGDVAHDALAAASMVSTNTSRGWAPITGVPFTKNAGVPLTPARIPPSRLERTASLTAAER